MLKIPCKQRGGLKHIYRRQLIPVSKQSFPEHVFAWGLPVQQDYPDADLSHCDVVFNLFFEDGARPLSRFLQCRKISYIHDHTHFQVCNVVITADLLSGSLARWLSLPGRSSANASRLASVYCFAREDFPLASFSTFAKTPAKPSLKRWQKLLVEGWIQSTSSKNCRIYMKTLLLTLSTSLKVIVTHTILLSLSTMAFTDCNWL